MKRNLLTIIIFSVFTFCSNAQVVITGYIASPTGTDSPHEYVQLLALENIDFATTNYSVVLTNNGTALSSGWIAGGSISYGFSLTSNSVVKGETFYVGGDGKLINGVGSTDISSLKWIRTINTLTTGGDGFGLAATGVLGGGGANADGIAVFNVAIGSITDLTVPVDAIFFGTGVGLAKPATGGYTVPTSDIYDNAQGTFGNGTNTLVFIEPAGGGFTALAGTYNPNGSTIATKWIQPRTSSLTTFISTTPISALDNTLRIVEPSVSSMTGLTTASPQSMTVDGFNLTGDLTINAPADFQLSKNGFDWSSSITLTVTGGSPSARIAGVSGVLSPISFQVRVDPIATSPIVSGNMDIVGGGATTQSVALSGTGTVLPVELISFNGKLVNSNQVKLKWATSLEIDNDHFEIQRSKNAIDFEKIGEINKKRADNLGSNYEFLDEAPLQGINYYRLKQVDLNGSFKLLKTISIQNLGGGEITIYPNPVSEILKINFADESQIEEINLLGLSGTLMHSNKYNSDAGLNISTLPKGNYLLNIRTKDNKYYTQKFIKN